MKEKIIDTLREELAAARRKLRGEADPVKRAEITGYIRALYTAVTVVNKA